VKTGHTIREISAGQVFFKFTLQMKWEGGAIYFFIEKNLAVVFSDDLMEIGFLRVAGKVHSFVDARIKKRKMKLNY
jgi:hypothetical protein